jgi:S-ribosylhomocysteine lyase
MKGELIMERIASFQVDHIRLNRGIYVSRIDEINGNYLTSFDIRMKLPNREPVINIAELHTMEHLGATFLRNHSVWKEKIVYFGPMGCRTGFYLILKGKLESKDIVELMKELYKFMAEFKGDIPGATAIECGNYLDQNLPMANYEAKKYLEETLQNLGEENLNYPD